MKDIARITMNFPRKKKEELQAIAEEKGITLTALIILAMNEIIRKERKEKSR